MSCTAETKLAEAAAGGSLNPQNAKLIRAQILAGAANALGLPVTAEAIMARAKQSGLIGKSAPELKIIQSQIFCNAIGGV